MTSGKSKFLSPTSVQACLRSVLLATSPSQSKSLQVSYMPTKIHLKIFKINKYHFQAHTQTQTHRSPGCRGHMALTRWFRPCQGTKCHTLRPFSAKILWSLCFRHSLSFLRQSLLAPGDNTLKGQTIYEYSKEQRTQLRKLVYLQYYWLWQMGGKPFPKIPHQRICKGR